MNPTPSTTLSYAQLFAKAWPIILANAAVPLLGIVDTAVMGHLGSVAQLAALAIATLIFSFVYWSFGFLRMGTSGFVARAEGAGDAHLQMRIIIQSLLLALVIATVLIGIQEILLKLGATLLAPPKPVQEPVAQYFFIRIWGAPATLASYVVSGVFIGRGHSRTILWLQLLLNISNALLDIIFAGLMGWGIAGIAWGTVIAEYLCLIAALGLLLRQFPWLSYLAKRQPGDLTRNIHLLLGQNRDIFLRTLFLLLGFAFFTHVGASFGESTLAANHLLLQFIAFSAFFLDGYAFVLESLAGRAFGAGSLVDLNRALHKSSVMALITALCLAALIYFGGASLLGWLTDNRELRLLATRFLPQAASYVALSAAAFQLDGLFIGAGYSSAMRNCSVVSTAILMISWYLVFDRYGNIGLWWAFNLYVAARALTLLLYLPALKRQCMQSA